MKILLAGGGSGGHFYPLIAIVQEINNLVEEKRLVTPKYYYLGDTPYDEKTLFEHGIEYRRISAGKMRNYFSPRNFFDIFKTAKGILDALWQMFRIFPDVVVGKGGYSSFPTMVAAWLLRIPVVIHESDAIPGRVNLFAGKFARRVGIAYEEAASHFPKDTTALVGIPIRSELANVARTGAREYLKLEKDTPVILVVGGSQGAQKINDVVIDILPQLLSKYQIIHQVGAANIKEIDSRLSVVLAGAEHKDRYRMFGFLGPSALAMAAGASSLVISRAGSTFIFEIASWGLPSIVIPIPKEISRDQYRNAFNYARTGASVLLDEANLSPNILLSEIERIMESPEIRRKLSEHAKAFAKPDAARKMAETILSIVMEHER